MSSLLDADDLDAEFLRLQQELASVADDDTTDGFQEDAGQNKANGKNDAKHIENAAANGTVTVAAGVAQSRPSWEVGLLERDLKDLRESAEIRKEAAAITGGNTASILIEKEKSMPTATVEPPKGKWHWNGSRWEWKVSSTEASAQTTAAVTPIGAADASNTQAFPETLADPVGPMIHPRVVHGHTHPKRSNKRMAAGDVWVDDTLIDWPENDFRIFVGDLAPDATDRELADAFCIYKSFNMARIVKDKKAGKCRGYGFVSFALGEDMVSALKEMNGKYVGSRPVKLKKSNWQKRNLTGKRRKELKLFRSISKPSR